MSGESQVANMWRMEGRMEGRRQAQREVLLRALQIRFALQVPPELSAAIETQTDTGELSHWLELAITASSLEEFRAAVKR
jgi:hypothetical protein